jgi:conjugative transposon TraN protein
MKKVNWLIVFSCLLLSSNLIFAQPVVLYPKIPVIIEPFRLDITLNKTTNLIFPYSIKSVDRGSSDILAQKASGIENVLEVKASRKNFDQTNLSVITADGYLYSFLINYSNSPLELNYNFSDHAGPSILLGLSRSTVHFTDSSMSEKDLALYSHEALASTNKVHGMKDHSFQVVLKITGISVKDDRMFFKFRLKNNTDLNYDIDQLRFFIRDEQRAKRTAIQEIEVMPVYNYKLPVTVHSQSRTDWIMVIPKITIPDKKYFIIEMTEKNGGRTLNIKVRNKKLMESKIL